MTLYDFLTTAFVLLFLFGLISLLIWIEKPIRDRAKKVADAKLRFYTSAAHLIDECIQDLPDIRRTRSYICESGYCFTKIVYERLIKGELEGM